MERLPRRILMTTDSIGGVWTHSLQLAGELGKHDVEVTLVVMGDRPSPARALDAASIPNLRLMSTDLRSEWMESPEADLAVASELLLELEADLHPDIVHLNGYAHAGLPFAAPTLVTAHTSLATWWSATRDDPMPEAWEAYCRRVAAGIAAADLIVAPSADFLAMLGRAHGAPRNARIIFSGRDPAGFAPGSKRPLVLSAGRLLDPGKNLALLCEAAEGLSFPLIIAGDNPAHEVGGVPLPANVHLAGDLGSPEFAARMSEAAVYASPARYEPFGMTVLEAALSGCALVLGDIPALRELWDGAALFTDPGDAGALRGTLKSLLSDPARTAELASRARRRAGRYTAARMTQSYLEAYASLLPAASSARRQDLGPTAGMPEVS